MNWTNFAPVAGLAAWHASWLLAFFVYCILAAFRGRPDFSGEKHAKIIGRFLSHFLFWVLRPIENALVAARVSPNAVTGFAVLLALGGGVALGAGWFGLGGWLFLATGITDILDGHVARRTQRVSISGAFTDSVADRLSEAAIMGGLAWHYRTTWVLLAVLVLLSASFLVSYTRARAEGLGVEGADVGAMQRPERIFVLSMTLIWSPFLGLWTSPETARMAWPVVVGLLLVGVLSLGTAVRRFVVVYRILEARPPEAAAPARPGANGEPAPARLPMPATTAATTTEVGPQLVS